MSAHLISLFHQISDQIKLAAEADDLDSLRKLDNQLVEVWRRILASRPRNPENIPVLTEFLLDQLVANADTEKLSGEIRNKVMRLMRLAYRHGREANLKPQLPQARVPPPLAPGGH